MYKLNVWLYKNVLKKQSNKYYGRIVSNSPISNSNIARIIVGRGSEIKEETIKHILDSADKIKCEMMVQGHPIKSLVGNIRLSIKGTFNGRNAKFDKDQHNISAQFTIGPELEKALKFTKVDVLGLADSGPIIGTVKDCFSNTYNKIITPLNALIITGKKIKIIGDDSQVGVYLTNTDSGIITKVSQIVVNSPRQLTIMLPAIDKGHYQLSVVTQFTGCSKLLKVPHSVSYRHHLQVE